MLYLVTGTPGAGKTLNTIKFINEDDRFQFTGSGDDKKPRPIYYHGIRDLNPEFGWQEISEDEAYHWFDLPSGSVIIFDEAYTVFPVRHGAKKPPLHVEKLATHRHHGYDIVMICQKVTGQLDPFIRGLVGQHQHYARIMGSSSVYRYVWDSCQENPNSKSQKQLANTVPVRLDKKYFGSYHSADEHTHKLNLPWVKIGFLVFALILAISMCTYAYNRLTNRTDLIEPEESTNEQSSNSGSRRSSKNLGFVESISPEIPDIPWSAPIYKDVIEAKTWPRPAACVHFKERDLVVCYTQQGTRMHIPREMALRIVEEGFFDWTKEEKGGRAWQREGIADTLPGNTTLRHSRDNDPQVTIIRHTPKPRMESSKDRPTGHEQPVYELVPRGPSELTPAQRQFF